tara:strand:+ start:29483 stop:29932 length:450 start_codon:yes stop_codon:yes gene_type:complete
MNKKQIELISNIKKCKSIIELVNDYYKVDCTINTRLRSVSAPRQIAMYLMYENLKVTTYDIGRLFKGDNGKCKDHATVLYGKKKAKDLIDVDKYIREDVKELQKSVVNIVKTKDLELEKNKILIELNDILIYKELSYLKRLKIKLNGNT